MLLEFQASGEEEEGEAEFRQQVDRLVELDPAQDLRSEEDAEAEHEHHLGHGQAQEPHEQGRGRSDGGDDEQGVELLREVAARRGCHDSCQVHGRSFRAGA